MKKIAISSIVIFLCLSELIHGQTGIPKAQAMFIYNFSRLIEWPPEYKSGSFIIGVFGSSNITDELIGYTSGKRVGAQPISIQHIKTIDELSKCHILFVPFSRTKQLPHIVGKVSNLSTLLITEKKGAIELGSAINFIIVGDKLKFEFKGANVSKYGIKVSSRLQEMAFKSY
jgi:hypothetical protein